jgi:hypothetical protein
MPLRDEPITLINDDLRRKETLLKAFGDIQVAKHAAEARRDDLCKRRILVAIENNNHKTVAKFFHGMFPDKFSYLGKKDMWFSFSSPR